MPVEKPAKAIKIMLRRHDKEPDDLVWRVHHETTEEEAEEEPAKTLQRRPRKRDTEQRGEGVGPTLDNTPATCSVMVEPRIEAEPKIGPDAVTTGQQEPSTEIQTSPGLQEQQH